MSRAQPKRVLRCHENSVPLPTALVLACCAGVACAGLAAATAPDAGGNRVFGARVPFVSNRGQIAEPGVRFCARSHGAAVFVHDKGNITYRWRRQGDPDGMLRERFGSRELTPAGMRRSQVRVNVFRGSDPSGWHTDIPAWDALRLGEAWTGIEVTLHASEEHLERVFRVAPGADPGLISVAIEGCRTMRVLESGELCVTTDSGKVAFTRPFAYQEKAGEREPVAVAYRVNGSSYGFRLGEYDAGAPLVIDPVLAWTTIDGGWGERGHALALSGNGDVYMAGISGSTGYPTTDGAYDDTGHGSSSFPGEGDDVVISKFDGELGTLVASTYLGGNAKDLACDIALDASGNVYIGGVTKGGDFPITDGAYDSTYGGDGGDPNAGDFFISRLDGNLSSLLASTLLGGEDADGGLSGRRGCAIAVAPDQTVYLTGFSESRDYPTTDGAFLGNPGSPLDAVVSRLNASLTDLLASTYFGGESIDYVSDIVIDELGQPYIIGETASNREFPTTDGAYDRELGIDGRGQDAYISLLDPDLTTVLRSTFLGGQGQEVGRSIVLSDNGTLWVTGFTYSENFPTTDNAFDRSFNESGQSTLYGDVFVCCLDRDLSQLLYSTYMGGQRGDYPERVTLDAVGRVWVVGTTESPFPTTDNADVPRREGQTGFVSAFHAASGLLTFSTYLPPGDPYYAWFYDVVPAGDESVYVTASVTGDNSDDVYIARLSTSPFWRGAVVLAGGWSWSGWFGYFHMGLDPWVLHQQHDWVYCAGFGPEDIWMWMPDMDWMWTGSTTYPYFYRASDGHWLWYQEGTASPRWFYDATGGVWESR
ncbi:SBBP repeat-containing protein [Verrucomicrobiota bacterium]